MLSCLSEGLGLSHRPRVLTYSLFRHSSTRGQGCDVVFAFGWSRLSQRFFHGWRRAGDDSVDTLTVLFGYSNDKSIAMKNMSATFVYFRLSVSISSLPVSEVGWIHPSYSSMSRTCSPTARHHHLHLPVMKTIRIADMGSPDAELPGLPFS